MPKNTDKIRPILKWAGGKSQMLKELIPRIPEFSGKYIEPFFGGGALYFATLPEKAVIADSNPELINLYQQIADNVEQVIEKLKTYENSEEIFYQIRSQNWRDLSAVEAAARTLFLNKTCFNGLYRVNKKGEFNTPFGRYKNPTICDEELLLAVSQQLRKSTIICGDYLDVLQTYASPGDFVFLDPPYIPVSEYGDFKRYTKEQFYEKDHRALAQEVKRLQKIGCYVILTNSNHPLVHQLYGDYSIDIIPTKRAISSKGTSRKGEDVIVTAFPTIEKVNLPKRELSSQVQQYPATRYMGSKRKLLEDIWSVASNFEFNTALDLFAGSGVVGYMFKSQGKKVVCNDYMAMSATFTKAMIENNNTKLSLEEARNLLNDQGDSDHFVENKFKGLYFTDQENKVIDVLRANIWKIKDEYKRAIALTALIRACTKKRPRGIFTYTGERYNDGRRDLQITLEQQFLEAVEAVNDAVFDNGQDNLSILGDAMNVLETTPDLVYIDPPYYSPLSDNEYVRRYHFVEGIARDWKGVEIQENTKTKKFKNYPTPFSSKNGATEAFEKLFNKYRNSILIVSYSSNSLPSQDEMITIMKKYKNSVEVIPIDYTYSFGNQKEAKTHRNAVQEYLFVGY
ncbi:MAG: Dam family site-specific DNA-(adenine-N6)-methyltransferase [Erysipelotrichaceae bacterium]|nr:Dam family site-specific DNA-(adenine-N6)-methyltransferase [Erysipelotrichaceae bacterium]